MVNNVGEIRAQSVKQDVYAKSLQSCPTLGNALDCSPPGSSVHGILQARILELAAMLSLDLPNREINPCLLHLLLWQVGSLPLAPPEKL